MSFLYRCRAVKYCSFFMPETAGKGGIPSVRMIQGLKRKKRKRNETEMEKDNGGYVCNNYGFKYGFRYGNDSYSFKLSIVYGSRLRTAPDRKKLK